MSVGRDSRHNYSAVMRVVDAAGNLVEREYLDIRPRLVLTDHPDNVQFTPSASDTWNRIGWRRLGRFDRYWIIADYSGVLDPWTELKPKRKTKAIAQLTANAVTGAIDTIFVSDVRSISPTQILRIENLDPSNPTFFETPVLSVNPLLKRVTLTPSTVPAPGIPFALSRVSIVYTESRRLTVPSPNRAFFEALNFSNPMNILVD